MKRTIVVGERTFGADRDGAGAPAFSPDSRRMAYKFRVSGGRVGVAIDGDRNAKAEWDALDSIVFDAAGRRLAYCACRGGRIDPEWTLLRNGRTPEMGGDWRIVLDGKPGETFDEVAFPVFSPDGKTLAFAARSNGKWRVIAGDKKSDEFDDVTAIRFATTARAIEFGARSGRELWWRVLAVE